jgi:large subunit ribosomal protein L6
MSRIGKLPIPIPGGVSVNLKGALVSITGPRGQSTLDTRGHVNVKQGEDEIQVSRHGDNRQDRAYHGLYQRLISNMVQGVFEGFQKELELQGVGYRAMMDGNTIVLSVGYSHGVRYGPIDGVEISTPSQTSILIAGSDKQQVGQVAAKLRSFSPPEPYKGKGIRYKGELVRRKVGKTGV